MSALEASDELFLLYREALHSLAHRMLGSVAETTGSLVLVLLHAVEGVYALELDPAGGLTPAISAVRTADTMLRLSA